MENLIRGAKERIGSDPDNQQEVMAKPYKFLTLNNQLEEEEGEVANFYVFQKMFQGEFQFDVLFRSQSSDQKLTSKHTNLKTLFYINSNC
jgi:mannosyl-oligosaccharide glucosidase